LAVACVLCCASLAQAHFSVPVVDRVAAAPSTPGTGWLATVYLNVPDINTSSIISAEAYIATVEPDFTFRCSYIDFPAGPEDSALDVDLATIGDFLDGDIWDVSDPGQLAAPMGNFVIRFTGLLNVRVEQNTSGVFGLPVLLDLGTQGYGGYRTRVGRTSIYRAINHVVNGNDPFFSENALVDAMGLFPIEVTYLNDYDTDDGDGQERVGVELYSFHPGGLPWPSGTVFTDPVLGDMAVTPPRFIYQPEDIPALPKGDGDADGSATLADFAGLQRCMGADSPTQASSACRAFDFDNDGVIDAFDRDRFMALFQGPLVYPVSPGDVTADSRIDLRDYRWFQSCAEPSGGDDDFRAAYPKGCEAIDFDGNGLVNLADFAIFTRLLHGPGLDP
jgi:hypothetical protein